MSGRRARAMELRPNTWIVADDASRARVLQVAGRAHQLTDIDDLMNPAGRAEDRELVTDAAARFSGHGGVGKRARDRALRQRGAPIAIASRRPPVPSRSRGGSGPNG